MTEEEADAFLPKLPRATAEELHAFARGWNTDGGLEPLAEVIRLPQCELATAKFVYWLLDPLWHLQYKTRDEVPHFGREGFDLVAEIERRVAAGAYREGTITFDPAHYVLRSGKVINFTSRHLDMEDRFVRDLPGVMYQPSGPGATPRPPGRPVFSEKEKAAAKQKAAERDQRNAERRKALQQRIAAMEKKMKKSR